MKGIRKSTFREIRSSIGRFMAILAIIALGVGFFAGLKVTRDAMVRTVKDYLDRRAFYDFRLISTLGFEEGNAEVFGRQEEVEAAEGAVSMDVIYQMESGRGVVKAHSLSGAVNTLEVIHGRLPEKSDECVADSKFLDASAIGSVLYIADDNEEDTIEKFAHKAYTIVGTVQSPLYIQFERGSTSLGPGRVDGFIYLPLEGFDTDYYTEIYVRFRQDNALYGNGYRDYIDGKEAFWEELAGEEALTRYRSIRGEAEEKLADGRRELEEKRADGEAELADAAAEIADAREKIADGEEALEEARDKIADGEKTIRRKKRELADAKETLAQKEQELADGEREIAENEVKLSNSSDRAAFARRQVEDGERQLAAAQADLESQSAQLEQKKAGIEQAYQAGMMPQEQYGAAMAEISAYEQQISAGRGAISAQGAQLAGASQQVGQAEVEIFNGEQQLLDAKRKLADGRTALEEGKQELADGERKLAEAEADLEEARDTLLEKETELADAQADLADGEQEYQDGLLEFRDKIADAEKELADAERELADLEEPEVYVLGRDTNVGYVCFENDSIIVDGIANIFPAFFFLVAAMVCVTTMNRMVEEQRTQIGVLKALGYSNGVIMSKYILYSGLAAVLGCLGGFALGTWIFPRIVWSAYSLMYGVAPIEYLFDGRLALISMAVSLLCSVGATWLSCRAELAEVAAQLMRPKAPKAGKRVFLEYIPIIWRRLSFLRKVSVRNIFRYKRRFFMMVLGISGCTALLLTGFGIKDSIADVAEQQFGGIQIYNVGIILNESAQQDLEDRMKERAGRDLKNCLAVMDVNMDIVTDKGEESVYLIAGDPLRMGEFINMHTREDEAIPYPKPGEGVITHKIAEIYGIQAGDVLHLKDSDGKELSVTISAVMENYIENFVYTDPETWRQAFGEEPEFRKVYANLEEGADGSKAAASLMDMEEVLSVTVNNTIRERISAMLESLNIIVLAVIVCAGGLAFIVLYNLTNINITERIREIATVKVLGFYKSETASYVFRENILLTAMGMLLGLALGRLLHAFVMSRIQVDMLAFDTRIRPVSYLYSALLTFVFAFLVNQFMRPRLDRISMTESLKSVD